MTESRPTSAAASLIPLSFALLGFAALTYTTADADLWGHVRFGLDLLRTHHLTAIDPYSFTQDQPWVNHEWLSELQMAWAWQLAGAAGLSLLKGLLATGGCAIAWISWRDARLGWRAAMLLVLAVGTIHITSSIRPQVWTFLFFAVLCRVLATDSSRGRWCLPPLFAVWANCHGGWIVGLGVLGVWAATEILTTRRRLFMWSAVILASLTATLLNPYGIGLWRFLAETVRPARSIAEWEPLVASPLINWIPWLAATGAAIWAASRPSPIRWPASLVLAALAYGSSRVMRIEGLYVEASAILLGAAFAGARPASSSDAVRAPTDSRADRLALGVIAALPLIGAAWIFMQTLPCVRDLSIYRPDVEAARALDETQGDGRLVTFFDWGEYAIWHFGPRLLVSMDGRRETVYSDARIAQHDAIVNGTALGFEALAEWRADYVWLPETSVATRDWLAVHGYRIDVETARSFIAVRADHPVIAVRVENEAPQRRCFPK